MSHPIRTPEARYTSAPDQERESEHAQGTASHRAPAHSDEPDERHGRDGPKGPKRPKGLDAALELARAGSTSWSRSAIVGLAVLAVLWTAYMASAFLIPVAAAFYLKLVLSPIVRRLRAWGIPWAVGAALVVGACLLLGAGAVYQLSGPANDWIARSPTVLSRVERRVRELKRPVENVTRAAKQVEEIADVDGPRDRAEVEVRGTNLASYFFRSTGNLIATGVSAAVLLYLLLATGELFLLKVIAIVPRLEDKVRAVDLSKQLETNIATYLLTVCVINLCLGAAAAVLLALLDMPNPLLWGVMVASFNFVPYLGAIASFVILTLAAFVAFDDVSRALVVGGAFVALNSVEAYGVTPAVLGRRMKMNPVAIFLAVMFLGWAWGVFGALLAVPMLVTVKILCESTAALSPLGELLSG